MFDEEQEKERYRKWLITYNKKIEEAKRKAYFNSPEYKLKQKKLMAKLLKRNMRRAAKEHMSKPKLEMFYNVGKNSDDSVEIDVGDLPSPIPPFDEGIKTEHI